PKRRQGNGALPWQRLTRYAHGWGPGLAQHVMGYGVGHSRRDVPEAMAWPLGAVLSLAACNRMVVSVTKHREACKTPPLASPPPIILVAGMGVKLASPTDESSADSRGRRCSGKRQQQRGRLRARGVWPEGHGAIVHGQMAEGETADTWHTFFGEL